MNSLRSYIATATHTLLIGLCLYWHAALQGLFAMAAAFGPPCGSSISATGLRTYTYTHRRPFAAGGSRRPRFAY